MSHVKVIDRHHVNIFLPMGRQIKAFRHLLELLLCFRDIIRAHKVAHDNLFLHRDISAGNVSIFQSEDGSTFGCLTDYDHAEMAKEKRLISSEIVDLDEKRPVIQFTLQFSSKRETDIDVVCRALKWLEEPTDAACYLQDAITSAGLAGDNSSEKPICATELGWNEIDNVHNCPDFSKSNSDAGERAGTLPYMSGEVIAGESLHPPAKLKSAQPHVHEAIHDIESCFWVLVHLCLTRKGPGINMRREELDEESPLYDSKLGSRVLPIFEFRHRKMELHEDWKSFEEKVIAYFHHNFEPLKPYVRRWWTTLILGYKYRGEEFYNIHDHIIRILDEAIDEIGSSVIEDDEATQSKINRSEMA